MTNESLTVPTRPPLPATGSEDLRSPVPKSKTTEQAAPVFKMAFLAARVFPQIPSAALKMGDSFDFS